MARRTAATLRALIARAVHSAQNRWPPRRIRYAATLHRVIAGRSMEGKRRWAIRRSAYSLASGPSSGTPRPDTLVERWAVISLRGSLRPLLSGLSVLMVALPSLSQFGQPVVSVGYVEQSLPDKGLGCAVCGGACFPCPPSVSGCA